jgi:hypothetical protein
MSKKSSPKSNHSIVENLKRILAEMKSRQSVAKKKQVFDEFLKSELERYQKDDIHIGI